jgi:hypothetical protein
VAEDPLEHRPDGRAGDGSNLELLVGDRVLGAAALDVVDAACLIEIVAVEGEDVEALRRILFLQDLEAPRLGGAASKRSRVVDE